METQFFIELLLLAAAVYLAFFKSYLTEKGKSAALKEDLQDLTREVESVKDEFIKEQEILKTDLQRILNNEITYRAEERAALIEFHGIISEWIFSILSVNFGNFNKSNVDLLIETRNRNATFFARAGIANSKISLLVTDRELVKKSSELYNTTLQFHHWSDMEYLKLQHICERQKSLTDRFLIVIKDFERNQELAEEMARKDEANREEAEALNENYLANRNSEREKIISSEVDFETLVKEYLKK